ncbi:MAG TPA: serine/threonine protein phosphatase, partial [Dehalococcoidia bacterium]|nr:serine/threonine protein phosphatase [Dehalococcoidia bacterium]
DHKSDPATAFAGSPDGVPKILLAHQPWSIFGATKAGADLQLSGHTHGGQFWPFVYAVRLANPYTAGLHNHDGTWIYVNRG